MIDTGHTPPIATAPWLARVWLRISPRLMPILAVLTALIITIPFMVVTGAQGNVGRGLSIAGTAYGALVEGSTGFVVNDLVSPDDLRLVEQLAASADDLNRTGLRRLARNVSALAAVGVTQAVYYGEVLAQVPGLDDEAIVALGERIEEIVDLGTETVLAMQPLIDGLAQAERTEVRAIAGDFIGLDAVGPEERIAVEALAPAAAALSDEDLLRFMQIVDEEGIVALERVAEQVSVLESLGLQAESDIAAGLQAIAAVQGGAEQARELAETAALVEAAGIEDLPALAEQVNLLRELYQRNVVLDDDVRRAIENQLPAAMDDLLLVRRNPPELLFVGPGGPGGVVYNENRTPEDPTDDRVAAVFLRLGPSALLFFPSNLETMIVRSIPFVIAGLAVALGFKAGLFNIGAEGQLYIGAILAVWVGFSPIFAGLPGFIHLPLVILVGILGGTAWGAIPGALKAFTGAHEVIVTIMLNYVAILLVDWLIKSTNPILLLDPTASTPRTPYIGETARLPIFPAIPALIYIAAGVLTAAIGLWTRRKWIVNDRRYTLRPILNGLLVALGGLFLSWTAVGNQLHIGFVLMVVAVWFTEWFLNRTTLGFELRTVGSNPDAARYAGMSVRGTIILAMALSGGLAGLAGVGEISGKVFYMQPAFFSGLGFDAIAVALLARTNPRNMLAAGFLWGALLTGAGLMQTRADISIDLVKIIQALIIMFIAADAIVRYIWRVPRVPERDVATTFSKGWGG